MSWRLPFGVCLLVLLGCSSTSAPSPTPGTDAGGSSEKDRVLASCASFAARACQQSAACCSQAYGAYDAEACAREFQTQVCQPAADAVQNGFATYDESAVEPCLAAHAQADAVCVPEWEQVLELRRAIWSACKVVRGTSDIGKGCTISATCAEPDGAKTANCVAGTCRLLEILPEGAACPFQSGDVSILRYGALLQRDSRPARCVHRGARARRYMQRHLG